MIKKTVKHIHNFRVFFLAFILVSFLYTVGVSPIDYSRYIGARFSSAVGMSSSASVPENPMNTLALQLSDKETKLAQKENELNKREAEIESAKYVLQNKVIWGMIIGIIILFILILINFFLDWRRRKTKYMEHGTDKF